MPYKDRDQQRLYQNKWMKDRHEKWVNENGPCITCGSSLDLQVHHIDPSKKVEHCVWSWAPERREKELEKCVVLCKKCHVKLHAKDQRHPPEHGTISRYKSPNYACRCPDCREAIRQYQAEYLKRQQGKE